MITELRNFKKSLKKDRYYLHALEADMIDRLNENCTIGYVTNKFNCSLTDFRSVIKAYYLGPRFNSYINKPSLSNLLRLRLPVAFLKNEADFSEKIVSYFSVRLQYLKLFIRCQLLVLLIFIKSLRVESISGHIICFNDLHLNNTIDTELDSYLKFCMNDRDINPKGNEICYSNSYSDRSIIHYRDITRGDFMDIWGLPMFIVRLSLLNFSFILNFFSNKNFLNLIYQENFKKIIVNSSLKNRNFSFVFNNSMMGYTPLWAQGNQKKSFLIFYSTNFGYNYDNITKKFLFPIEWRLMSWDYVYVWDKTQQEAIASCNNRVNFKIVNKINFLDSGGSFEFDREKFNLVIFDVSPRRLSMQAKSNNLGDLFYTSEYMKAFINDIILACDKKNIDIYIKKKRKISSESKDYSILISKLISDKKLLPLDDSITPERIVKKADLVISPVYSTPSLIAKILNVEAIYYDATGAVSHSFLFNRDVQVINTIEGLRSKISNLYENRYA
jgi:polysaccharide biosynthesis PFTS motif protein